MPPDSRETPPAGARQTVEALLALAGLPPGLSRTLSLSGAEPALPSTFAVGTAAQASIAAAALAACAVGESRGAVRQQVSVAMLDAAIECLGWFSVDGEVPSLWDPVSGLYRCADGWVRIHANFRHHREGALELLGLEPRTAGREQAEHALRAWRALDFEQAAAQRGLVATALRSFDQWDATPQGRAVAAQPLLTLDRLSPGASALPLPLPPLAEGERPLAGLRVLELTRILAGPVGGRTLAAHGADVMLVNSPHLPNIDAIADTSRGKRSAHVDLKTPQGRDTLWRLIDQAHVFIQGYRPGALDALGFSPQALARRRPGIVCVSLSAYGTQGPWAARRGFDSLVQTAMGFNVAEGQSDGRPRPLPTQILDQASGHLIAMAAAAAVWRQQREGGSWLAQLSLAQTGQWLRGLGRVAQELDAGVPADLSPWQESAASGFGQLCAIRHGARLSRTPAGWDRPSMPPGSHAPVWTG